MDPERPHRSTSINNSSSSTNTTSTTSELFICFTSRLSSSSMKISSKSILSPGRAREPSQISLSSSLSRRLRSNGSMKGGQASPMFPTNGKKRGCAFENPEPSSPKVTCIGQVRVKTKKQGKKFRAYRSKRRGEVSFRKVDHNNVNNGSNSLDNTSSCQDYYRGHFLSNNSHHHQQQQHQECKKWVHLPLTICEALRAFGAELNCFLPCRSSCMANQRDKEEKTGGSGRGSNNGTGNGSSCGAVFARWLVTVQDGEGEGKRKGKGREIELVVGGEDNEDERRESSEMMMRSSRRRHVFEDIEINDCGDEKVGDEEEARVSICVPPKNALLLMRCRSDPVKMAALANRFLEAPIPNDEEKEAENECIEKEEEEGKLQEDVVKVESEGRRETFEQEIEYREVSEVSEMFVSCEATQEQETPEAEAETEAESSFAGDEAEVVVEETLKRCLKEETIIECQDQENNNEVEEDHQESMATEEAFAEAPLDLEKLQREANFPDIEQETEDSLEEEVPQQEEEEETEAKVEEECEEIEKKQEEEKEKEVEYQDIAEEAEEEEESEGGAIPTAVEKEEAERTQERSELECQETREPDPEDSKESESQQNLLPDCLLLMMCEPKLSMEVSKETWVCSTDFIRWVPERKKQQPAVKQKDGGDEPKRRISIDSIKPPPFLLQPPRSSCSFPVAPPMATAAAANRPGGGGSMATVIEQKLVGGKGYEPFVLTRCKSEPMRSSANVAPDACFWKNGKLEPATLGVGAAGVGF